MIALKTTTATRQDVKSVKANVCHSLAVALCEDIDALLAANAVLTEEITRLNKIMHRMIATGQVAAVHIKPGTYQAGDIAAALRAAEPQADPRHVSLWNAMAAIDRGRR